MNDANGRKISKGDNVAVARFDGLHVYQEIGIVTRGGRRISVDVWVRAGRRLKQASPMSTARGTAIVVIDP